MKRRERSCALSPVNDPRFSASDQKITRFKIVFWAHLFLLSRLIIPIDLFRRPDMGEVWQAGAEWRQLEKPVTKNGISLAVGVGNVRQGQSRTRHRRRPERSITRNSATVWGPSSSRSTPAIRSRPSASLKAHPGGGDRRGEGSDCAQPDHGSGLCVRLKKCYARISGGGQGNLAWAGGNPDDSGGLWAQKSCKLILSICYYLALEFFLRRCERRRFC